MTMLQSVIEGHGTMAFNHPEFGGWDGCKAGMIMLSDMLNPCSEGA